MTPSFSTFESQEGPWRIGVMGNPYVTVVFGVSLSPFHEEMARARNAFVVSTIVALLLILAGGWLLANRALHPVQTLAGAVEQVNARGLDRRVPEVAQDAEFGRLTHQFNAMMDRLEKSFGQATRFSADAAHELKTPLTILQGQLEEALRTAESGSAHQESYSKLLEEVQRLKSITQKLLLLSLADAGQLTPNLAPFNLSEAITELSEDTQILGKSMEVASEIDPEVWIMADDALMRQVLHNLGSNAVKYNKPGGRIRFQLRRKGNDAVLKVWNRGDPIGQEERERIFDRFYRADPSRNRKIGGAGLGLSLAREIARAHSGELKLEAPREGWVGFSLSVPLMM